MPVLLFQATRRRLALWYTAVTAVLVAIVACGFYTYARATLIERVDDTLHHAIEVVERSLSLETIAMRDLAAGDATAKIVQRRVNLEASFRADAGTVWANLDEDHIDFEWFSPQGVLLWTTFEQPSGIAFDPAHDLTPAERTVRLAELPETPSASHLLVWRQASEPVVYGGELLGYLRASHPWFEVARPAQQLLVDLCWGSAAVVAVAGAIGWFLSGLAIAPVRESYQRLRQFTADASHELRNPIATIQTQVQVALAEPAATLERPQLETIERLTRRLARLVDDLLFLARQDSPGGSLPRAEAAGLDWVDFEEIVLATVAEQSGPAQQQAIDLVPELAESPEEQPFVLRGDRDQLARLLTNLIDNALRYAPPQTQVRVSLARVGRSASGRLAPTLRLEVQDQGPGIPPEALPHLFDRFYRVDAARSGGGTGLGLAIAWAIVQRHQGRIQVESQLGQGTQVIVTLPLPTAD